MNDFLLFSFFQESVQFGEIEFDENEQSKNGKNK